MFFVTTGVLFSVLALAQAVTADITSPTESTVWSSGDQVTVNWDPSKIPAEDDSPSKLVLGHPEDDSENLDLDHPLAQDFPLSAGSVQFTVPDLSSGSNYIVVLFAGDSDDGDASPQFTINSQPKLVKKAPQEMPDSDPSDPTETPDPTDTPDEDPTDEDPADPGTGTGPSASSSAPSGAPTSPAPAAPTGATTSAPATTSAATTPSTPKNATSPSSTSPLAANTSSLNPSTTGSGSIANGALSFAQAHHTGAISLSAAVAAMGLVFAF